MGLGEGLMGEGLMGLVREMGLGEGLRVATAAFVKREAAAT